MEVDEFGVAGNAWFTLSTLPGINMEVENGPLDDYLPGFPLP